MIRIKKRKILAASSERIYSAFIHWWGGIGCRVSFFITAAMIMVAVTVGAFFLWQGKVALNAEIRGRALYIAKDISALTLDDIITENRPAIYKKISSPFASDEDSPSGSDLLYIMVYKHNCELLIGSSETEVFLDKGTHFYTSPSVKESTRVAIPLKCTSAGVTAPVFETSKSGVLDLIFPILSSGQNAGYVRVGISARHYAEKFSDIMKKALAATLFILVAAIAFSQIIAVGITRPILQLSDAADKLSRQNWHSPLPVRGRDEISRLSESFNRMALTLKERELGLSRGNRDLFVLHTAGLDLMESLHLDTLLVKIAARAEDLVRADTTAVAVVKSHDHALSYLGVFGSRAHILQGLPDPLESGGIYNWIASYGTPLLIANAATDFRLDNELMKTLGIKSIMTAPLWSSNRVTGLLSVVNKKGEDSFDKQDLRLFTVFSNLAGAALQNASLYTDLIGKMNELKSAQEQLVHSTKMAAIGELAANVAHEVNNPLTSVLGYTTHLLKTLDLPESPKRILGMMEQETLRVRKIIRNLLDFSRQKTSRMQPTDLLVPLSETLAFIAGAAESSDVRIHEEHDGSPVLVNIDANEIKQVFINIINNAFHAMPSGGDLKIAVRIIDGNEACVDFTDTGVGIARENISKIFEPFFSTKDSGDGTGLGLSISYRIVQNHGGKIDVRSVPGKGTSFKILLPLYKKPFLARPTTVR